MIAEYSMGQTGRFRVKLLAEGSVAVPEMARYVAWEWPDGFHRVLGLRSSSGTCRALVNCLAEMDGANPIPAAEFEEVLLWARHAAGHAATAVAQVVASKLVARFSTDSEVRLISEALTVGSFICRAQLFEVLLRLEHENQHRAA